MRSMIQDQVGGGTRTEHGCSPYSLRKRINPTLKDSGTIRQSSERRQVLESPSPVLLPTPLASRKRRKTSREVNTGGETNPTSFMKPTLILDTQSSNQQEYVSSLTSDYSIAKFSYNSSQPVHHLSHKPVSWQDQMSWTQLLNTMVCSNGVDDIVT